MVVRDAESLRVTVEDIIAGIGFIVAERLCGEVCQRAALVECPVCDGGEQVFPEAPAAVGEGIGAEGAAPELHVYSR